MSIQHLVKVLVLISAILLCTPLSAQTCSTDTTQTDFQSGTASQLDLMGHPGSIVLPGIEALDGQNTTVYGDGNGFNLNAWTGQTFTPLVTGSLTRAELDLFCSGCGGTPPDLILSLRATSNGLPVGPDLTSGIIPGFSLPYGTYRGATFTAPYLVTAGVQYALVVRPVSNQPGGGSYFIIRGDGYSGGDRLFGSNGGTAWSLMRYFGDPTDAGFKTYVTKDYLGNGIYESSIRDSAPPLGSTPIWNTLSWIASTPADTQIRFQVAGSNSSNGPFNYVGPDSTSASYFTGSAASLAQFNGLRYLKYRAVLTTSNSTVTPTLSEVTSCANFTVPAVSSLSTNSGPLAGGSTIQLNGAGLTGVTQVNFGATSAPNFTFINDNQITVTVPSGTASTVNITVTTPGGTSAASAANQYTYLAAPGVTGINPSGGPLAGGTSVVITGTDFTPASLVSFGATQAGSVTFNSPTQITAISPANSAGTYDVIVTTAGGSSSASGAEQFTYAGVPSVTSVTPLTGAPTGGTSVVITGTDFVGNPSVKFGTLDASSVIVDSPTQITAISPPGSVGSVDITVTATGGTSATNSVSQFTYVLRQLSNIPAAVGGGMLSAEIISGSPRCSFDPNNTIAFTPPAYNGITPPHGGLKLTLTGCEPGETARVSVTWPGASGLTLKKYGKTPSSPAADAYYDPANASVNGNTVSYDITDNGLGDDTFSGADGVINDPAVLVPIPLVPTPVPTVGQWAQALLTMLTAVLGLGWLRRRRQESQ